MGLEHRAIALLLLLAPVIAYGGARELGGHLTATIHGKLVALPAVKTDVEADVRGDVATVTVTQTFANPSARAVHARYLFPLNRTAAVHAMQITVGDERIYARIQEVRQAEQTFVRAKSEGRSAALLKQHRPNMFTQEIANLMPGVPIVVSLRYVQTVPRQDDEYELVVPLVVGPRFQPPGAGAAPLLHDVPAAQTAASPPRFGAWELEALPDYPNVFGLDVPDSVDAARASLRVRLHGGMPILRAHSDSHALRIIRDSEDTWTLELAGGRSVANRDFVLRYALGGDRPQAGLLAHHDARGGFFSLLIEPPATPAAQQITPREMVFLLDCSGSMSGLPMNASKAFMRQALRTLRPGDWFRIVRFSDAATEFSSAPMAATRANIEAGVRYTNALNGSGGTQMLSGIRQALAPPVPAGAMRVVVFLTDGYIGNEHSILSYIHEHIGDARLYGFGVGTAVNRYLLSELARTGRGFVRYMDPTENVEEVATALAARLQSPVLTDIHVDWGGLAARDLNPDPIPDLFAGQSLRIVGRYDAPGPHLVRVRGKINGKAATLDLRVDLPAVTTSGAAVALIWARTAIASLMNQFSIPVQERAQARSDADLQQAVTRLGLDFSLLTRWTAFVAVTEKVYNAHPDEARTAAVPLSRVAGVSDAAYGQTNPEAFVGNAAPEPAALSGLLLTALLTLLWLWRQRQRQRQVRAQAGRR